MLIIITLTQMMLGFMVQNKKRKPPYDDWKI